MASQNSHGGKQTDFWRSGVRSLTIYEAPSDGLISLDKIYDGFLPVRKNKNPRQLLPKFIYHCFLGETRIGYLRRLPLVLYIETCRKNSHSHVSNSTECVGVLV
jgi:hypothetical protein